MPNKSVLSSPETIQHLSRTGFNMSQSLKFTSSCGQLLPVYFDVLNPSEKIRFNAELFTRTQPLSTAAMVDIDEYVEFFFVPMKKIFSPFNQLITAVDDFTSSVFAPFGKAAYQPVTSLSVLPYLALGSFPQAVDPSDYILPYGQDYSRYGQTFDCLRQGSARLFDMLGYNVDSIIYFQDEESLDTFAANSGIAQNYNPAVSPAALCAYQAIYYDYYRLSSWEYNAPLAYNLDNCASSMELSDVNSPYRQKNTRAFENLVTLRYRPYARDYFKAIEPSPLVTGTGVLNNLLGLGGSVNESVLRDWLSVKDFAPFDTSGVTTTPTTVVGKVNGNQIQQGFTLSQLTSMYAYKKMLEITGRAGKHYDDQILAHYGFEVPKGISDEVYYLGQMHNQIHIGQVISTSGTDSQPLGTIAGQGYGKNGNSPREFTAPCHGIFMAIYSAVPRVNYQVGLYKLNTMFERFDFYHPELDKLGQQPLFGYELGGMNDEQGMSPTEREGWQWRYMHLKTKFDRATGAFDNWRGANASQYHQLGAFRDWTISFRGDSNGFGNNSLGYFLCSPMDMNQIFLLEYIPIFEEDRELRDGAWRYHLYYRDPLIHDLTVHCYKSSPMSRFGVEL